MSTSVLLACGERYATPEPAAFKIVVVNRRLYSLTFPPNSRGQPASSRLLRDPLSPSPSRGGALEGFSSLLPSNGGRGIRGPLLITLCSICADQIEAKEVRVSFLPLRTGSKAVS